MDSNLVVAIVTSVCTALPTAGVAITALVISNRSINRLEHAVDKIEGRIHRAHSSLEKLTGAVRSFDKRLSIIEDRVGR